MKKILIPLAIYKDNPIIPIHGIRVTYIKKLIKNNLLPIFISPLMPWSQIKELYKICAGAYFIGGEDFNPFLYQQKKHSKTVIGEADRDIIEIKLLRKILKDKKPFLGICRGIQALAIASGGSLIQHLPDRFSKEDHNPNKNYDDLSTSDKHSVLIDKNSKTFKIINRSHLKVNSYHHQAVDNPGKNLRVVGRSPEGVIEIIEHIDNDYFCIGIQSHPEIQERSFFEKIFQEFSKQV